MIKQFVPQEACLKCQGCCRFKEANSVWAPCLLDEEIQDLLDREIPAALISVDRRICLIPNPKQDGFICPFLNFQDNKCRIYSFHPFECQLYPFLINLRSKKVILTVDQNCPYIEANLKTPELREYSKYLSDFLNNTAQVKLLKDNPQIIQAYEDILEVVELKLPDEVK